MPEEGPYEILPYAEIEKLKKQMEDLKKQTASSNDVLDQMKRMTGVMENLLYLFENASASMKKEGEGPLGKKVDKLIDQHEIVAESILSMVSMIKELKSKLKNIEEKPHVHHVIESSKSQSKPRTRSTSDLLSELENDTRIIEEPKHPIGMREPTPSQPDFLSTSPSFKKPPLQRPQVQKPPMQHARTPPPPPMQHAPPKPPSHSIPPPPMGQPPIATRPGPKGPIPMQTFKEPPIPDTPKKKGLFGFSKK